MHDADRAGLEVGNCLLGKACVLQRVLIVIQHAIDVGLIADGAKDLLRITAESDAAHLACLFDLAQRRQRLFNDLLQRYKFDVVAEDDVDVIGAEAVQRYIDAFNHSPRRKIEVGQVVASQFRAEQIFMPRQPLERNAQQHFAHAPAVKGARVEESQPAVEGRAHTVERFGQRDGAEFLPQR